MLLLTKYGNSKFCDFVTVYSKYPKVRLTLNTGWSSSQNAGGHRILALQAQLVTAHGRFTVKTLNVGTVM